MKKNWQIQKNLHQSKINQMIIMKKKMMMVQQLNWKMKEDQQVYFHIFSKIKQYILKKLFLFFIKGIAKSMTSSSKSL